MLIIVKILKQFLLLQILFFNKMKNISFFFYRQVLLFKNYIIETLKVSLMLLASWPLVKISSQNLETAVIGM